MPPFSSRRLRHPVALAVRLLLWPAVVLLLADLAASSEDDALAAGLLAFTVLAATAFVLALLDGLVLPSRPLVLVCTATTLVVVGLVVAKPLVDLLFLAPGRLNAEIWAEAAQSMSADLPSSIAFFLVLVGAPVVLGAVTGVALRRSTTPRPGRGVRTPGTHLPQP